VDALAAAGLLDPKAIAGAGVLVLFAVVFAETGLLVGFFLPGDSLLFTAGVLAAGGELPLGLVLIAVAAGALLGAQTGYLIGRRAGPVLFDRPDTRLFKREYVDKAELYFEKFGPGKAVFLARFIPIVRTFLNPFAGVVEMPLRQFTIWNVVGGLVWSVGLTLLGYTIGSAFDVDRYLLPAVAVIVAVSFIPVVLEVRKARKGAQR